MDEDGRPRSGFFIHGGSEAGSAGCIDIGGGIKGNEKTEQLRKDIAADPDGIVPVTVSAGKHPHPFLETGETLSRVFDDYADSLVVVPKKCNVIQRKLGKCR